jgi:hypothetical protein
VFYLTDSEVSLLSGNTQEFHDECLDFLEENWSKLTSKVIYDLLYRVIAICVVANSGGKPVQLDQDALTIIEGYEQRLKLDEIKVNATQDPGLKRLISLVKKAGSKSDFVAYQELRSRVTDLLEMNGLWKTDFDYEDQQAEIDEDKRVQAMEKRFKEYTPNVAQNNPDQNYEDYTAQQQLLKANRLKLELALRTIKRFVRQYVERQIQKQKEIEEMFNQQNQEAEEFENIEDQEASESEEESINDQQEEPEASKQEQQTSTINETDFDIFLFLGGHEYFNPVKLPTVYLKTFRSSSDVLYNCFYKVTKILNKISTKSGLR